MKIVKKMDVKTLRKLISEVLLREETEPSLETNDSLDEQVDKYLAQFESEAKSSKNEGKDFRALVRRIVSEADEGDDDESEKPEKLDSDKIDVESFCNDIVRLIDNYDSLLEIRSTITRRALNFIAKSYTPDVLNAVKDTLQNDHDIVAGKTKQEVDSEEFEAPHAERAGGPGGGVGESRKR